MEKARYKFLIIIIIIRTGRYFVLLLYDLGNLEPLNKFNIFVKIYYIYRTSMLSFGGCLQESKPILRFALVECLDVWINEEWGNLELYHMKNNAAENNY